MALHMQHTQGRFNNHTTPSLYRIMVTATSIVGATKIGITVPREGLGPTSLAFWASVLPLHHIGSLLSQLYPCPPVCVCGSLPLRSVQTTTILMIIDYVYVDAYVAGGGGDDVVFVCLLV